jgi:Protein of unknown function (DUF2934)
LHKAVAREKFTVETQVSSSSPISDPALDLQQAIRRRAEEIYIHSGRIPGRDVENWTQAEREILELTARQNRRSAIIVKVHGVQYVGEYTAESADGYVPGEIGEGASVGVRIEGDKMFVRRSNGKELQTHIVRKIG